MNRLDCTFNPIQRLVRNTSRPMAVVAFVVLAASVASRSASAQGAQPFAVAYDISMFADTDTTTAVEFTIGFSDRILAYRRDKSGAMIGKLLTQLTFTDEQGKDPWDVQWTTAVQQPDSETDGQPMVGIRSIAMRPGVYHVKARFIDVSEPSRYDSAAFDMPVPAITRSRLALSDLKLVLEAYPSNDTGSIFYRSGYTVMPNVLGTITPPFAVLNTYLEIYNANNTPTSEFTVRYRLADEQRRVFHEEKIDLPRASGPAVVDLHAIQLDSLPSGTYYVIAKVYNAIARFATDSVLVARRFTLVNPGIDSVLAARRKPAERTYNTTGGGVDPLYAGLKEAELNEEFAKSKFIAVPNEITMWESLSGAEPKARMLTQFWAMRDENPATPENESRDEYYKRVEQARSLYSSAMTPKGWDSDRGRILLVYGKPDNVDRHFQDFNRKPYEIWKYSGLNYEFVFVDRTQTGFYKLVHSTAPSEVHYENWERDMAPLNRNWKDD